MIGWRRKRDVHSRQVLGGANAFGKTNRRARDSRGRRRAAPEASRAVRLEADGRSVGQTTEERTPGGSLDEKQVVGIRVNAVGDPGRLGRPSRGSFTASRLHVWAARRKMMRKTGKIGVNTLRRSWLLVASSVVLIACSSSPAATTPAESDGGGTGSGSGGASSGDCLVAHWCWEDVKSPDPAGVLRSVWGTLGE